MCRGTHCVCSAVRLSFHPHPLNSNSTQPYALRRMHMHFVNNTYVFRWSASGLLGLAVTLCLIACISRELTQERAVEMMKSSKEFQEPISITLRPEYRQSLTLIGIGSQTTKKEEF